MWREITRLKELNEGKAMESNQNAEKLRELDQQIDTLNGRI